jgi:hypothetical protein
MKEIKVGGREGGEEGGREGGGRVERRKIFDTIL